MSSSFPVLKSAISNSDTNAPDTRPWKVITHHYPDTDSFACAWAAVRRVVKDDPYELCFVPAGNALSPEEAEGYRVLTMDTGKGELDQHEKRLVKTSSFKLFCDKYGLADDPCIKPILELTVQTDNVEKVDYTSIHYVLKGLAYNYRDPVTKEVDWQAVMDFAFIMFDILYGQGVERAKSEKDFKALGKVHELRNGVKIGQIWHNPRLRDAAFNDGCDVVVWTQDLRGDRKGCFHVGIQCNRNSRFNLDAVMSGLRIAEAGKRSVATNGHDLRAVGNNPAFGGWFLHDSRKLIACGTRGHELEKDECTKLAPFEIMGVLRDRLGKLPKR